MQYTFSNLASSLMSTPFYEWMNPKTDRGEDAYPFRTGISAVRIAVFDILKSMESNNNE